MEVVVTGAVENLDGLIADAIAEIYPRLYQFAAYRLPQADAEDAVASALERVWAARRRFDAARGPLDRWLVVVAFNAIRDEARRARRRDAAAVDLDSLELSAPDEERTRDRILAVQAALLLIPQADSELLSLKYGSDLSNSEIAAVLGKRPNAVAVAIHRSLKRLRARLEDE